MEVRGHTPPNYVFFRYIISICSIMCKNPQLWLGNKETPHSFNEQLEVRPIKGKKLQFIERTLNFFNFFSADMGVNGSSTQVSVPQQYLNFSDVFPAFQQMGGEAVA